MNTSKCKRYRDVWVAPGTQMFEALEAGDTKKAAQIYEQCELERQASMFMPGPVTPRNVWFNELGWDGIIVKRSWAVVNICGI
jgi:hypothetical protein